MTVDYEDDREIPPLYHYCDTNAFKAIVENSQLWLSSLRQSNDSMEGTLSYLIIKEVLGELRLGESAHERVFDMWLRMMDGVDCCALCLSSEGDLLSQWRGYAANGSGFSIGFDANDLSRLEMPNQDAFGSWEWRPGLYYVAYDENEQRSHFKRLIDDMLPHLQVLERKETLKEAIDIKFGHRADKTDALRAMGNTIFRWLPSAYMIKGAAFAEEREARIVVVSPRFPTVHRYRTRGSALVPYIPVPIRSGGASPIQSVRLGPTNPTPVQVVESFLEANGLGHVPVLSSQATYRG